MRKPEGQRQLDNAKTPVENNPLKQELHFRFLYIVFSSDFFFFKAKKYIATLIPIHVEAHATLVS